MHALNAKQQLGAEEKLHEITLETLFGKLAVRPKNETVEEEVRLQFAYTPECKN